MAKKIYGLLGRDISYSLSPRMHNAAFDFFGIDAKYTIIDKEPEEVEDFFEELLSGKIDGINVTVPYKIRIKEMLEKREGCSIDKEADCIGAVNTIKVKGLSLTGFNTDGAGFYAALVGDAGISVRGKNIFILGAGGAGRAIVRYLTCLAEDKPEKIYVYDVDNEQLSSILSSNVKTVKENEIKEKIAECGLIVNATPLGTKKNDPLPINPVYLHKRAAIYDLVYARETELVGLAKKKGLKAINGLGMLVNQAALAFNIWTGKPIEEIKPVMRESLPENLKRAYEWNI